MNNILLICRDFRYFASLIDHFEKDKYHFKVENYSYLDKIIQKEQIQDFIFLELDESYEENIKKITYLNDNFLCPLYVFSRDNHELEKKAYHDQGATGYIDIPFSSLITSARVKAAIKFIEKKKNSSFVFKVGPLSIDLKNRTVYRNEFKVKLTIVESKILKILLENLGSVVPKDVIISYAWQNDSSATDNALGIQITRLRNKLHYSKEHEVIETIWGTGYKLNILPMID